MARVHAAVYVFPGWHGCKLLCALAQNMYWFLVIRKDLGAETGDLARVKGLRIGAAAGAVDGLRKVLQGGGIDPERDVEIGPVPGAVQGNMSFGITAAKALEEGKLDGFWANGMAAEVAVRRGVGSLLVDAHRVGASDNTGVHTFPALVATDDMIGRDPAQVTQAVRAIVAAQRALQADPDLAPRAAAPYFPDYERSLIADLIRRDAPFYDPSISATKVAAVNRFAYELGLTTEPEVPYERIVAVASSTEWQ